MLFKDNSDYFDNESPETPYVQPCANEDNANNDMEPAQDQPTDSCTTADRPTDAQATDIEQPAPKPARHRFRNLMLWLAFIILIIASAAFYIRYCNPYAIDAHEYGRIINVEKRGIIFKTYEADVAPSAAIDNMQQQYSRRNFSFADDSLAHAALTYQQSGQPVDITYSRYFATLPWRGASVLVITAISPTTAR